MQQCHELIDVAEWLRDEEVYPEGKRVKTLVFCPLTPPFAFLDASHGYLFKRSPAWAPEQFWVEIIAYQIGQAMGIDVPKTYAGLDSERNQCGALVRWFLESHGEEKVEGYLRGGDLCQEYHHTFDRKRGKQHNFETVSQIFSDLNEKYPHSPIDWLSYWSQALVFDALIGNTDRHQDNWGIIECTHHEAGEIKKSIRISPVFDNGASLGYEIEATKFASFDVAHHIARYCLRGTHHMKWRESDEIRHGHHVLIQHLVKTYPETKPRMASVLGKVNSNVFESILQGLSAIDLPIKLSIDRAIFMLKLLNFRHQLLLQEIGL